MTIANTKVLAKVVAAFAVAALALSAFALSASAQTTTTTTTTTSASSCASFNRDLTVGSSGADVTALQTWLISKGFAIAAGATGYFGGQTQAALAQYQASVKISPAAGYFGPITRAQVNAAACSNGGGNTGGDTDDDDDDDSDDDDDNGSTDGETSIEDFQVSDSDDNDLSEGQEEAELAEIEFDVEDADAELERADFIFDGTGNDEERPWNVFETVYLMNDGDVIGEQASDDSDDWEETDVDDVYRIRISDIGEVFDAGESVSLILAADLASSIDGTDDGEDWTIEVATESGDEDGFRFTDSEDVQTEEGDDDVAEVTIDEEGSDNDYSLTSSSDDPESRSIEVDDNNGTDEETVFIFEFEADEDATEDLEVEEFDIDIAITNPAGGDPSISHDAVIDEVIVMIDGESYDADVDAAEGAAAIADGATGVATYTVELDDEDFVVSPGDTVEVEVLVSFRAQSGNYDVGTSLEAEVDSATFEVVGTDSDEEVADPADTVSGEEHTVLVDGLAVTYNDEESDTEFDNNVAEFHFVLDVEAFGSDVELDESDFIFEVNGGACPAGVSCSESIDEGPFEEDAGVVTIEEDEEGQITYTVSIVINDATDNGEYEVTLVSVDDVIVDETLEQTVAFQS